MRLLYAALGTYQAATQRWRWWWRRPTYARVGSTVCCCDAKHRTILSIKDDLATMADGRWVDVFHCMEAVQSDGSCHAQCEWPPE